MSDFSLDLAQSELFLGSPYGASAPVLRVASTASPKFVLVNDTSTDFDYYPKLGFVAIDLPLGGSVDVRVENLAVPGQSSGPAKAGTSEVVPISVPFMTPVGRHWSDGKTSWSFCTPRRAPTGDNE